MTRWLACALLLAGCRDAERPLAAGAGPDDEMAYEDDDLPAGHCRGADTDTDTDTDGCDTEGTTLGSAAGGSPGEESEACRVSADCVGAICAARFDPVTLQRGTLACQFACVPLLDDTQWCSDDASCCDAGAVCTQRGYCVMLEASTTTGG